MCIVLGAFISFVHLLRQVSCPYVLYLWYPYELYIRYCLRNTKLSLKGARNKVQGLSLSLSWLTKAFLTSNDGLKERSSVQVMTLWTDVVNRPRTSYTDWHRRSKLDTCIYVPFEVSRLLHSATKLSQIRCSGRVIKQCCPVVTACRPTVVRSSWFLSVRTGQEGAGPANDIVKAISDIIYILLQCEQSM